LDSEVHSICNSGQEMTMMLITTLLSFPQGKVRQGKVTKFKNAGID